jgi:sulfate adenylyltransferase
MISPWGGSLVDLLVFDEERKEALDRANSLPGIQLSDRAVCDLELLATGAFSPLRTFMNRADFERVSEEMRLSSYSDGTLFPMPVTLPVDHFKGLKLDKKIALRDSRNDLLAVMTVEEIYEWPLRKFALEIAGTEDSRHPLVAEIQHWGKFNISGKLLVLNLPKRFDFKDLRLTPAQTREKLAHLIQPGRKNIVAFQTRNPIHRVHEEMTKRAAESVNGALLLHPVVGMTMPGDVDYFTRVRTYITLANKYYDRKTTLLALLPLAMRMAGPREALWHALIRRNYGATHFIVGRDHASPGIDSKGRPFYPPDAARKLVKKHSSELGVKVIPFEEMVFLPDEKRYEERSKVPESSRIFSLSGTRVRGDYLDKGKPLPAWLSRKETANILTENSPPRHRQGVCLWFTGLSGSGKSSTAEVLKLLLMERGRRVTLLDGDVVRTHLSKGLGFSKTDRDTNILRMGFVASEIVRHGGTVICAAVSPYRSTRNEVRNMMENNFIEVFVDTPLAVCEERDVKGMYARARRGEIHNFTGIDDPYETPENAELTLDTVNFSADQNAAAILKYLVEQNFIAE